MRSPAAVLAVCEHCQTAVHWQPNGAAAAGTQASLSEGFTRLYRGATGQLDGERLEVLGRVRYRTEQAFWDEWFVRLGETDAWVTEDDHALSLQVPADLGALPPLVGLTAGTRFSVDGKAFEVDEVGEATCVGISGELPAAILTGEVYRFIDASSLDGSMSLGVELDDEPPTAFLGRWLAHESVVLDDEGAEW
ncbi:MAG: DUF4178 domain-containing protein [Sandaracinaceae bacterium]